MMGKWICFVILVDLCVFSICFGLALLRKNHTFSGENGNMTRVIATEIPWISAGTGHLVPTHWDDPAWSIAVLGQIKKAVFSKWKRQFSSERSRFIRHIRALVQVCLFSVTISETGTALSPRFFADVIGTYSSRFGLMPRPVAQSHPQMIKIPSVWSKICGNPLPNQALCVVLNITGKGLYYIIL